MNKIRKKKLFTQIEFQNAFKCWLSFCLVFLTENVCDFDLKKKIGPQFVLHSSKCSSFNSLYRLITIMYQAENYLNLKRFIPESGTRNLYNSIPIGFPTLFMLFTFRKCICVSVCFFRIWCRKSKDCIIWFEGFHSFFVCPGLCCLGIG